MAFTPEVGVAASVKAAVIAPVLGSALVTPLGSEVKTAWLGMTAFTITPSLSGGKIVAAGCPADAQGNIAPRQTRGGVVETKVTLEQEYDGDGTSANSDARFPVGSFIVFDLIYNTVTTYGRYGIVGRVTRPSAPATCSAPPARPTY
jgi:hypothetical protein